ncbi:MAG: histidine kinase [Thermodesulfatator sp.]|nr:MAG: histidine kinase [Thermodesulfatator sp.]
MRQRDRNDVHSVTPEVVIDFLKKTLPFNELDDETLKKIAEECTVDFFPKGTTIFRQDETVVEYLYIIQKGGVKIYLKDEEGMVTLKDFRGEGSYIGALPIIQNTKANLNVETVEDTFCFLLKKETFLELIQSNPRFAQYYLKSFSEKFLRTAYAELRQHRVAPRTEGTLYLFSVQVGDLIKGEPKTVPASATLQHAAAQMAEYHIGSLLVTDENEKVVGIVTDKDLRTKVVAQGRSINEPVANIMVSPVETIESHKVCFDALLAMMSKKIHHLAVKKQGKVIGVITSHDIMVLQGSSPLYLFREIVSQRSIEGLYPLSQKVPLIVRTLIEEGAKPNNITRMITVLNDHILDKLLTLMQENLGPPPVPFCWLLMGSEGRKEQTFRTDQDNALMYQDPQGEAQQKEAEEYFRLFGQEAIEHLVKCGYPRCPGNIMASNPKWCQPYSVWQGYFDDWILRPEPKQVLHATIFFDFRPGFGKLNMGFRLREHLNRMTQRQEIFLLHLAKDCLESRPPLTFFKNFIVEKDGEHKNRLDIKTRGLVPFVDFARLMSLKFGIKETNTLGRLELLYQNEHISKELYSETVEAYEFQMQLRFVHQLQMMEAGKQPDNYINPRELTDLEKQTLKEAFAVIIRLQSIIKDTFPMI